MNRKERRQAAKTGRAAPAAGAANAPGADLRATLEQGLAHHQRGELSAAQECYRRVLTRQPTHPDALHLMGMLAYQVGELATARELIERAIKHIQADAAAPTYHNNLGEVLRAQGEAEAAVAAYRRAIALDPASPGPVVNLVSALVDAGRADEAVDEALALADRFPGRAEIENSVGNAYLAAGDAVTASDHFARAAELAPDVPEARFNLGNALQQQGIPEEAAEAYRQALALRPDYAEAHTNLGSALLELGEPDAALRHFEQAVAAAPGMPEAQYGLGDALAGAGRLEEAEAAYGAAVALDPDFAAARFNRAATLIDLGRPEEAEAELETLLAAEPEHALARNLLGIAAAEQGRLDDAIARYRAAAEADPHYAEPAINLGNALLERGDHEDAREWYAAARELDPRAGGLAIKAATVMPVIMDSREQVAEARARMDAELDDLMGAGLHVDDPIKEVGATGFYLAYHGENDRLLQAKLAQLLSQACPALNYVAPSAAAPPRDPERERLRVGFVSRHFANHTIGRLNLGLIEALDRERFEVVVFQYPPADDPLAQAIADAADRRVVLPFELGPMHDAVAAEGLDILYFADIGMEPVTYFLAFARLAPVQCVAWGHPMTTGITTVDHFLSAEDLEVPGAEDHYTETLVRLPTPATRYHRPRPSPAGPGRADFGFAGGETVYLCPQTLFKFHPDFDPILRGILEGDPKGVLALVEPRHPRWRERLMDRFARTMPGVADRVRFVPQQPHGDFLHLLAAADVILDPPLFTGGNSTLEALSVGTPVVTLPGDYLRDRLSWAWYRKMGVEDWVAADAGDYVAKALALGTDPDAREAARARILEACPVLFGDDAAVRGLEDYFLRAAREAR